MKTFKKIILGFIVLFVLSSLGGYVYFDIKFSPPKNYLTVSKNNDTIPITWIKNEISPIAAMVLPVKIDGIATTFYMQFDTGSSSTIFYKNAIESIHKKFPTKLSITDITPNSVKLHFSIGKIAVTSNTFSIINHGDNINWNDPKSFKIIGTLGNDFLEKKIAILNFKENYCFFGTSFQNKKIKNSLISFDYKKRKILIPAKINDENYNLLYDSGTSAFELITSKKIWSELSKKNQEIKIEKANSWGNVLKTYTTASDKNIKFENIIINLNEVTYIEGTTFVQNTLMKLSGMGGMIGNKIFKDKVLILDCKNQKMGIFENIE
jgi:hypothetical protein